MLLQGLAPMGPAVAGQCCGPVRLWCLLTVAIAAGHGGVREVQACLGSGLAANALCLAAKARCIWQLRLQHCVCPLRSAAPLDPPDAQHL